MDQDGETVTTTSRRVAEVFGKRHADVLRVIASFPKDEFNQRNFTSSSYMNSQNKKQPMYTITRDGFSMLVMGFTGDAAYSFKVKFIAEFNRMETKLNESHQWDIQRYMAADSNKKMAMALKDHRDALEKQTKFYHYSNESLMINKIITGIRAARDRNCLTDNELAIVKAMEEHNRLLIANKIDYDARRDMLVKHYELLVPKLEETK